MSLSGLYKSSKSRNVLSEQPRRSCPWCWTHGRFESWNLSSLLSFSAATPGNKCAVWDTWLYLRHYEKSALLLCRVDSLWQNSGDENLLFLTFFVCDFCDCLSKFYSFSLSRSHAHSLAACLCVSSSLLPPPDAVSAHFLPDPNSRKTINHAPTWFQRLMIALCTYTWEMPIKHTEGMK